MIDRNMPLTVAYCISPEENSQLFTGRLVAFSNCGVSYSKNYDYKIDVFGPNVGDGHVCEVATTRVL